MASKSNSMITFVDVEQYMSIYGPFILTTLGIVGNILSILIFLSPRYRRQSSHFYLLSLALCDLCFLIINLLEDTFRNHNHKYQSRLNFLDRSSTIICIFVQYARNVTRLLSSWIIVSFTIERLLVVFYPLKRATICRRKLARFVVLILFILSLLININVPFHYGISNSSNEKGNDTICDVLPEYRSIYMRFAISIMTTAYIVPMCIIGFVNMLICCKLWKTSLFMNKEETMITAKERHRLFTSRSSSYFSELLSCIHLSRKSSTASIVAKQSQKGRASSSSQYQSVGPLLNTDGNLLQGNGFISNDENQRRISACSASHTSSNYPYRAKQSIVSTKSYIQSRTHRVTATLLLVSCSFLLLNTPYCVIWIANYVQDFKNLTLQSMKEITELFMLMNFCINFLLYCASGKVFRSEIICLLRCQWKELYDRSEGERVAQRKSRPKIEIQLNDTKFKPRSMSLHPHDQQQRLSFPLHPNDRQQRLSIS